MSLRNDDQGTEAKTKKKTAKTVQSGSRFTLFRLNYLKIIGATSKYPATHALFKSTAPVVRGP